MGDKSAGVGCVLARAIACLALSSGGIVEPVRASTHPTQILGRPLQDDVQNTADWQMAIG